MNERERAKSGGLLDPTVSVGRIAGVRIGFNWSWAIVFALIVWSLAASYFPSRYPFLTGGATAIAATIGRGFGYLLIGGGVLLFVFVGAFTGVWFAVVGLFLVNAAETERRYAVARTALEGLRVGDLMVRNPVTTHPDQTIAAFMDESAGASRHALYPVVRDGE